ncbi:MAG: hypothetical protein ABJG86_09700 [Nitratireductor sp.]
MVVSFPLNLAAFADRLMIRDVRWQLRRNDELSGLGSGQTLSAELAPPLWIGSVQLELMDFAEADQVQAAIETLDGPFNSFYLCSPRRRFPQADPDGTLLGAATPTIHTLGGDNKSVRLAGVPAVYQLTRGDFLAFDYGAPSRRAFHRIVEDATADGAGITPSFEVRPHIRPGATTGLAVTLIKPAAKVFIVPDSFDAGVARRTITEGMSFQVMQRL